MAYRLGVVAVVYGGMDPEVAVDLAIEDGYDHIDGSIDWTGTYKLPIGDRVAFPGPRPGCSTPAAYDQPGMWERSVAAFRRAVAGTTPDQSPVRMEPWAGSICNSTETIKAMLEAVPGLRLLVDTGHVADWGGDPLEILEFADHVQLRDGLPGQTEAWPGEGDVDFKRVIDHLRSIDYPGLLSIEYFNLPEQGWPLDDPRAHAAALRGMVRPLL